MILMMILGGFWDSKCVLMGFFRVDGWQRNGVFLS